MNAISQHKFTSADTQVRARTSHNAAVLVQTTLNNLDMAKVMVLAADISGTRREGLLADIERKRKAVKQIASYGFATPKYTFGMLGPNGHAPGIELVLDQAKRAVEAARGETV